MSWGFAPTEALDAWTGGLRTQLLQLFMHQISVPEGQPCTSFVEIKVTDAMGQDLISLM